jgi:hypothetical protein
MKLFVRTIGIARAKVKIGMTNLAYNVTRLAWLEARVAPSDQLQRRSGGQIATNDVKLVGSYPAKRPVACCTQLQTRRGARSSRCPDGCLGPRRSIDQQYVVFGRDPHERPLLQLRPHLIGDGIGHRIAPFRRHRPLPQYFAVRKWAKS